MNIKVQDKSSEPETAEVKFTGRFTKGSERARLAGAKGGSRPHPTGTESDVIYKQRGYIIKWDKKKHLWEYSFGDVKEYARSVREAREAINRRCGYIETPIKDNK